MSSKSVLQECHARSVLQERLTRVSSKSVSPERCAIVSSKGVLQECRLSVWTQGVSQVSLLEMWQICIVSVCQHTCRHSGSWASSCFLWEGRRFRWFCLVWPMRNLSASSGRAWNSMLWSGNCQWAHPIGCVPMRTTSIASKRISKPTPAARRSTRRCRCPKVFFWCWILWGRPLKGFGAVSRSPLPRPQETMRCKISGREACQCWTLFAKPLLCHNNKWAATTQQKIQAMKEKKLGSSEALPEFLVIGWGHWASRGELVQAAFAAGCGSDRCAWQSSWAGSRSP